MVIPHVSRCESRDLHDGSAKRTYRASSPVWTANFLSFPFPNRAFSKACSRKLATPSPSPRLLPWAMGKPSIIPEDAPNWMFAMTRKVTSTPAFFWEEIVRVMFLQRLRRLAQAGQTEKLKP